MKIINGIKIKYIEIKQPLKYYLFSSSCCRRRRAFQGWTIFVCEYEFLNFVGCVIFIYVLGLVYFAINIACVDMCMCACMWKHMYICRIRNHSKNRNNHFIVFLRLFSFILRNDLVMGILYLYYTDCDAISAMSFLFYFLY